VADGYRVVYAICERAAAGAAAAAADPRGESTPVATDMRDLSVEGLPRGGGRLLRRRRRVGQQRRPRGDPFFEIDPEGDDVLATNLRGRTSAARRGRHMQERGSGRIVNLASLAGQWGRASRASTTPPQGGSSRSHASRQPLARSVTVNAVAPGRSTALGGAMPPEQVAAYVQQIPVQRLGRAEEVAALVAHSHRGERFRYRAT
jgi:NAD(P)-dependent dehydrogenase (short-subunit alcohol dehydrogenase family)